MPKPNFASKAREIRRKRLDDLIDARIVNRKRQEDTKRELRKSPITYGEDGEMNTHEGPPIDKIIKAQNAFEKKERAAEEYRKARAIEKNSKVLDGVELGKKVKFISFSNKTYSGRVVKIDLNRGLIFLESGFFRRKTNGYRIEMLKAQVR